jgi:glutamyl-tRNA synthetase
MSNKVRVRFAPSPTGPLHIGGLRTALFNYLFAKKNKGDFILRIEDTDQARYVEGSEKHILESLSWCGLNIDEGPTRGGELGPYKQSERKKLYKDQIDRLMALDKAYVAFDSKEDLDNARHNSEKNGETFIYNALNRQNFKNSLTLNKEETAKLIKKGGYVVRFKTPAERDVICYDVLRGKVVFSSSLMDDKVLYKSDGNPTYHFANVVDDYHMNISHVIRGEEWLPSLGLHWLLYEAFEWRKPKFVHLPLILKPVGKGKLSKRDGEKFGFPVFPIKWSLDNQIIDGYKEAGFLPGALVNFLSLLGWNPGNEKEFFTLEQLINAFSLKNLNNSGARFDHEKNIWFNQQHIQGLKKEKLVELLKTSLEENRINFDPDNLATIAELIRPRLNLLTELTSSSFYFFNKPKSYNVKAVKKLCGSNATSELLKLSCCFLETNVFKAKEIKISLEHFTKTSGLNFGKVLGLVRLAVVGKLSGADLFMTLEIIGKNSAIKRIEALVSHIK